MENYLTRKLEAHTAFNESDRSLLNDVVRMARDVQPGKALLRAGDPSSLQLVLKGIACRQKHLPGGKRQIVEFLIPGDFCDVHETVLRSTDQTLSTITRCRIVEIPHSHVREMIFRPAIKFALAGVSVVNDAVSREWIVNLGCRPPDRRIVHFFCEMIVRCKIVGLSEDGIFHLPLTQSHIGSTLGISTIHVNRTIKILEKMRLFERKRDYLFVPDFQKMAAFSGFDQNYLHLGGSKLINSFHLALAS